MVDKHSKFGKLEDLTARGLADGRAERQLWHVGRARRTCVWRFRPEADPELTRRVIAVLGKTAIATGSSPRLVGFWVSHVAAQRDGPDVLMISRRVTHRIILPESLRMPSGRSGASTRRLALLADGSMYVPLYVERDAEPPAASLPHLQVLRGRTTVAISGGV
jgi:hypothetical protein